MSIKTNPINVTTLLQCSLKKYAQSFFKVSVVFTHNSNKSCLGPSEMFSCSHCLGKANLQNRLNMSTNRRKPNNFLRYGLDYSAVHCCVPKKLLYLIFQVVSSR